MTNAKKPVEKSARSAPRKVTKPIVRNTHAKEIFPEELNKAMGIVTTACRKVGIDRDTYYLWRNGDPEFAAKCDKAAEYAGDFVESKLYELISEKNPSSIIFYCKTRLRHRGYLERKEITTRGHEEELRELHSLDE